MERMMKLLKLIHCQPLWLFHPGTQTQWNQIYPNVFNSILERVDEVLHEIIDVDDPDWVPLAQAPPPTVSYHDLFKVEDFDEDDKTFVNIKEPGRKWKNHLHPANDGNASNVMRPRHLHLIQLCPKSFPIPFLCLCQYPTPPTAAAQYVLGAMSHACLTRGVETWRPFSAQHAICASIINAKI